jgi:hypothetical protein
LMLSSHRVRGFPCLLCPSTCPSIMSRSSDLLALETWPKQRNFSRRIFWVSRLPKLKSLFSSLSKEPDYTALNPRKRWAPVLSTTRILLNEYLFCRGSQKKRKKRETKNA